MINHHKVMCGCEIFISASMMQSGLNSWRSIHIEKMIIVSEISHSRISFKERGVNVWLH